MPRNIEAVTSKKTAEFLDPGICQSKYFSRHTQNYPGYGSMSDIKTCATKRVHLQLTFLLITALLSTQRSAADRYELNSDKQSHPVGTLRANAWGFYDMHGNVSEWVQDFYDKNYYSRSPKENPTGPSTERKRVVRGGSWINLAYSCRSAFRGYFSADYTDSDFGFRSVKIIE